MAESNNLSLPYLEAGQAQKHVTHNEALRMLDALVQLSARAISAAPPGSPEAGERHIVAASATGAFAAQDNKVAIYEDGAWRFLSPRTGWRAWNEDAEALLIWTGSAWNALETGGGGGGFDPDDVEYLYLNDAAPGDADVKFAMRGETALLHAIPATEGGNGDVQLQISKEAAGDTASVFFSTNFSGRAEFGLAGSDNFKLKVSADGASWTEALDIDKSTGRVRLPAALALTYPDQAVAKRDIREKLSANRTYYVRTDGSDSNDGLANTSGGAFLTIQKAIDFVSGSLDLDIYTVTIQVGAGTYSHIRLKPLVGSGAVVITGDITTPTNVVVSGSSTAAIGNTGRCVGYSIQGFQVTTGGSGGADGITCTLGSFLTISGNMDYAALVSGRSHLNANGGTILINANYTISAGAARHWVVQSLGNLQCQSKTVTIIGTPAFTDFAMANTMSLLQVSGNTYSGSASGNRYSAVLNSVIQAGGAILPGSSGGTTATGGVYI
ncbi:MAG: DUF2793 domain-containing protein [Xanthobacteraceae bacterium]|nr:DUF2793 domain-containing protein [Xanthobacteraceae bacterium]